MSVSIFFSFLAAGSAVLSSIYWGKASLVDLPPIDPATGQPSGPVGMGSIYITIVKAGRDNMIAARLTAVSALLSGVSILLTPMGG